MRDPEILKDVEETARWMVREATKHGAETAESHLSLGTDFEIEVRDGEVENLSEAESHGASLTVSKDGRRASVQSSDTNRDHLSQLIQKALSLCRYTDRDDAFRLPTKDRLITEVPDLDLFDPDLATWSVDRKRDRALAMESALKRADPRITSNGASFANSTSYSAIANSLDFSASVCGTFAATGVSGFADDAVAAGELNTGRKQSGGWSSQSRFADALESADSVGARAAHNITRLLGGRKPHTGRYPIYFEPSAARGIWRHLLAAIRGGNLYRQESFLMGALNQQVTSNLVTMTDYPLIRRAVGSQPFDDEGVSRKETVLIDEGQLRSYLLSTYSATKLGMETTGHAGGTGNLVIEPGSLTERDLLRDMGTGVWVTGLSGQGVNIATGDYSRGALGLWVENGEVQYPVMEFTINGNLRDMFKNIRAVGRDPETGWTIVTPGLIIDGMTISGT